MSSKSLTPKNLLTASSAPTGPNLIAGDIYYDTVIKTIRAYDGSAWVDLVNDETAQTITGRKTFASSAVGNIPIVVQGFSGQTANLQEWHDEAAEIQASVSSTGIIQSWRFSGPYGVPAILDVVQGGWIAKPGASTDVPVKVRGFASQTANLQEWQNSTPTTLASIDKDGLFVLRNSASALAGEGAAGALYWKADGGGYVSVGNGDLPDELLHVVGAPITHAKGQMYADSGAFTGLEPITVGADGTYLKADSAVNGGVKWAALTFNWGVEGQTQVSNVSSSSGSADVISREDHQHGVVFATAVALAGSAGAGSSTSLALADHQHGITFPAATTGTPSLNIPHGTAPTTPVNGDVWTTTAGIYVRVNGSTVGPLGTGGGGGTPASTVTTLDGLQSPVVGTGTNYARDDHKHGITGLLDLTTAQTVSGTKTFSHSSSTIPLIAKLGSGQYNTLQEWQAETGEVFIRVTGDGDLELRNYDSTTGSAQSSVAVILQPTYWTGSASADGQPITLRGYTVGSGSGTSETFAELDSNLNILAQTPSLAALDISGASGQSGPLFRVNDASVTPMFTVASGGGVLVTATDDPGLRVDGTGFHVTSGAFVALEAAVDGTVTAGGTLITPASTASVPSFSIPHGTAPSAPTNGDLWTTTAGIYVRINGATVGPLSAGGGTPASTVTTLDGLQSPVVGTGTNYARDDHKHGITGLLDLTTAQTVSGSKTFQNAGTAASVIVKDHASTTLDVFQVQTSSGGRIFTVDNGPTVELWDTSQQIAAVDATGGAQSQSSPSLHFYSKRWTGAVSTTEAGSLRMLRGSSTAGDVKLAISMGGSEVASFNYAGRLTLPATTTAGSSVNIPHGTAPTTPVNGDFWTTTAGLYGYINGGVVGPYGAGLRASMINMDFSTGTADSDPGAGYLKYNNATPASVTEIYIDTTDVDSNDITAWIQMLDDSTSTIKGYLTTQRRVAGNTGYHVWQVNSITSATGYYKIGVAFVAGQATTYGALTGLVVGFSRTGDKGLSTSSETFSYSGTLATATGAHRLYNDDGATRTIQSVRASVGTQPTGASILVDVNLGGTTIFSTQSNRPTIAVSTSTDESGTPDTTAWTDGGYLTVDIDQIGSTVAGADLTVTVVYTT